MKYFFSMALLCLFLGLFADQSIVFSEDFSSDHFNWGISSQDNLSYKLINGVFNVQSLDNQLHQFPKYIYLNQNSDFLISCDIQFIKHSPSSLAGFSWGSANAQNEFRFYITPTGLFSITNTHNDSTSFYSQNMKIPTFSPSAFNKLTIEKKGDVLTFYINNDKITTLLHEKFYGNSISLLMQNNCTTNFDNILIKQDRPENYTTEKGIEICKEDFSSSQSQFEPGTYLYHNCWLKDNKLVIESQTDYTMLSIPADVDVNDNFVQTATVQFNSGNKDSGFGLTWSTLDRNNMYFFEINPKGYFKVAYIYNGKETDLQAWSYIPQLISETGENTLQISKYYHNIEFSVNNQVVASFSFLNSFGNNFGFYLDKELNASFDNLSIKKDDVGPLFTKKFKFAHDIRENDKIYEPYYQNGANCSLTSSGYLCDLSTYSKADLIFPSTIDKFVADNAVYSVNCYNIMSTSKSEFGIILGSADNNYYYLLTINLRGEYRIKFSHNDSDPALVKTGNFSYVKSFGKMVLAIQSVSNKWNFYVNGILVDQVVDTQNPPDYTKIGLYIANSASVLFSHESLYTETFDTLGLPILAEHFTNNLNCWNLANDSLRTININDNKMLINNKTNTTSITKTNLNIYKESSFRVSSTMTWVSGVENNGYGLAFGMKDSNNYALFEITANGYYGFGNVQNGLLYQTTPWTFCSAINPKGTNTIEVANYSTYLCLFINSTLVQKIPYFWPDGFGTGIIVYDKQTVSVNDFTVWYKPDSSSQQSLLKVNNFTFKASNPSWKRVNNDKVSASIENSLYSINGKSSDNSFKSTVSTAVGPYADYSISSSINWVTGSSSAPYGLIFNKSDTNTYMTFTLTAGGLYSITSYSKNSIQKIVSNASSLLINQSGDNKIKITKHYNVLYFYVNDRILTSCPCPKGNTNETGVMVNGKQKVIFKNLEVLI